jgi:glyoxylase-like metal-dependent hydrolase (beta-lactamase superfamily II)
LGVADAGHSPHGIVRHWVHANVTAIAVTLDCASNANLPAPDEENASMKFECLPVTRLEQNCSILWCESSLKAAVIDPGGDIDQLQDFLKWENLTLEVILVTHGHIDHAGGAAQLAGVTGARIEGPHRDDEHLLNALPEQSKRFGLRAQSFTPDRWLNDADQIRFGGELLEVMHCPGHTKGHVAYFHRGNRYAFVGDILFRHAIGAWEHADGNLAQLVNSIRSKLFALGDDVGFLPGHGETSTFGHERMANPFIGEEAMAKWRTQRTRGLNLAE